MKIYIPTKQEKEKIDSSKTEQDLIGTQVTTSSGVVNDEEKNEKKQNTKLNINTATQAQLETLPGIGPSTATKIITYRKEKGKFNKIEDVKEVSGIGNSKFEQIKEYITIK